MANQQGTAQASGGGRSISLGVWYQTTGGLASAVTPADSETARIHQGGGTLPILRGASPFTADDIEVCVRGLAGHSAFRGCIEERLAIANGINGSGSGVLNLLGERLDSEAGERLLQTIKAIWVIGYRETVDALLDALPAEVYWRSYLIQLAEKIAKETEERRRKQDESSVLPPQLSQETQVLVAFPGISQDYVEARLEERVSKKGHERFISGWSLELSDTPDRWNSREKKETVQVVLSDGRGGTAIVARETWSTDLSVRILLVGQGSLE